MSWLKVWSNLRCRDSSHSTSSAASSGLHFSSASELQMLVMPCAANGMAFVSMASSMSRSSHSR
eukprot:CAMPEP_0197644724 /NCGR_PEP_ID=MMETSP1338-20131121/17605_1 /TAXON_ID=43686 ORGANISM="Pelagodinium beii, Strain RCC1491" /NCGR_SAMPLE_ID=MMETSP1338 /ASSEMBLY_ACC=CAM_ASM_000754 /LENGTH=63 /DNA_ID=CAMNT_0043218167 /DNA_START=173 /DNA_END=361 /DNA_ORIENTATION=+